MLLKIPATPLLPVVFVCTGRTYTTIRYIAPLSLRVFVSRKRRHKNPQPFPKRENEGEAEVYHGWMYSLKHRTEKEEGRSDYTSSKLPKAMAVAAYTFQPPNPPNWGRYTRGTHNARTRSSHGCYVAQGKAIEFKTYYHAVCVAGHTNVTRPPPTRLKMMGKELSYFPPTILAPRAVIALPL